MIGTLKTTQKEITIVGGGIAGLLAAYVLDKKGYEVTLYEAAPRCGGMIGTSRVPHGIIERAAHSFLATPAVFQFCKDLGVELLEVRPDAKARFILRRGRLRRFPLTFVEAIVTFLRAYFIRSKKGSSIGTLEEWATRFLGKAALHYLIVPFVRGIYGARPSEIRVEAAFPSLVIPPGHSLLSYQLAKRLRPSLKKARIRSHMVVPKDGMGSLVEKLEEEVARRLGPRLKRNSKISEIPQSPNVMMTLPAHLAADLFSSTDRTLSVALKTVQYAPLISITIFAPVQSFRKRPSGVGVLIPETENRKCLGILFTSSSFSGRSANEAKTVSLTMMLGGTSQAEILGKTDQELIEIAHTELTEILGYQGVAPEMFIQRWEQAIPIYDEKIQEMWRVARETWCSQPGRLLFGNYTGQVSIRGMIEAALSL